jgi:hypothetical protein
LCSLRPRVALVIVTLALVAAAVSAGVARADEERRAELPWAVRGEAFVLSGAGAFAPTAGSVGATVQRTLARRFAWEESIAWGVGNRKVDGRDTGWMLAGTGRVAAWTSEDRTHALTFALGTALIVGGGWGTLNFLFGEAGYEYRSVGGLRVIVAVGPNLLLSQPAEDKCVDGVWLCRDFRRGGLAYLGHLRAGMGWAF